MKFNFRYTTTAVALSFLTLAGCTSESPETASVNPVRSADAAVHDHPKLGPHGGDLIELGDDIYHAELKHDDAESIATIYLLDGAAIQQMPIEAREITINLQHDGKPKQFKLPADPVTSDPKGKASRFTIQDADFMQYLEAENGDMELVVMIDGTSYRGDISHHHEGHDH